MRWITAAVVLAGVTAHRPGVARAESPDPRPAGDLGAEVRGVFAARCAGCHGPDLPRPKGRFGYVLDLRRVAGNPELVVPGRPDESELWHLVRHGDMPPADTPYGPPTAAEKDVIRAWVAAGAPEALPVSGTPPATTTPGPSPAEGAAPPPRRVVRWLGKFHLLLLHFPIALVLAAGVGEVVAAWRGSRGPAPAVRFCLSLAAVAAVPTVALGWLHAAGGGGVGSPGLLTAHRWLGTAAGVWVVGVAVWVAWCERHGGPHRGTRAVLMTVGVLLVAGAAHFGGSMAHGTDFFDW
jgi:mono/diheme cytochrome c family protein